MPLRPTATTPRRRPRARPTRLITLLLASAAGVTMAGLAGMAAAASPDTLATARNATLSESIVVDSRGLTVYELRPESTRHLLCTKGNGCFQIWRPVSVASAKTKLKAGHGVSGKLGILHRNGLFQVTLAGHPLYRFVGDGSKPGAATGQDAHTFGGTWHVVATSAASAAPVTTTTTPTATTTTPTATTPTTPTVPYYPPLPIY